MHWLFNHIVNVGFWVELLVGTYTVYIGVQVQRRSKWTSPRKLTGGEIGIGVGLLIVGCFLLGIHAVRAFG